MCEPFLGGKKKKMSALEGLKETQFQFSIK